jgi:inositol oxygenase
MEESDDQDGPLKSVGEWDDFVAQDVYPQPASRAREQYRDYAAARDGVREFYRRNHRHQSYDFVTRKRNEYLPLERRSMSVFESLDFLNTLVDDSDPDIELDQLQHLLQTSEAIRADGHEDWFVLTGLIHDLGKVLCLFGEPQWAVVGDTFPVGCAFSDRVVFSEFFSENPDATDARYQSRFGVYGEGCGLRNVRMSWGHDEYRAFAADRPVAADHDRTSGLMEFRRGLNFLHAVVLVDVGTRYEYVVLPGPHRLNDLRHLIRSFSCSENHLGKALAQRAMVIDIRKTQIFEREISESLDSLILRQAAALQISENLT